MVSPKVALIAGASGLVGSHCLQLLLQSPRYHKVISVGRKLIPLEHPKLQQQVVDFNHLEKHRHSLIADDVYCCLGTTIKKAGSQEKFRQVDYTYVVNLAKITVSHFASQFLVVSALGADASSRIFYNRVKGEMEQAVKALPFTAVHIFQPSLLLGNRKEVRLGEKAASAFANVFGFLFKGPLRPYKAIQAQAVAKAMLEAAKQDGGGVLVHSNEQMLQYS
ncbi:NAD-dependent epimerase/dehydratase family protein [Rufibacter psychrotolerans]|uniref:NAD-dependent epimerase/dehydratase family protein n=1 Tax=Rufibacter psychrotolerans TaxID=2812556 RepID=UPI0019680CD7|nr:NAD-dependent epimerase/dehydratase family protein [Rufibacter sp. SYSU D00308]